MISDQVRDFLILHLKGGEVAVDESTDLRSRAVALGNGFVSIDRRGPKSRMRRRILKPTTITEKGRRALAAALASWLDAALRAEQAKDDVLIGALDRVRDQPALEEPEPAEVAAETL